MYTREDVLESTHACHPLQKLANWQTENYLEHALEPLCTLAWLHGEEYPEWAIQRAWKYVLENHAHDSLGCTSVDEVFEEVMNRYHRAYSLAEQTLQESLRGMMQRGKEGVALYLFNRTSAPVGGVVPFSFDLPRGMGDENFHLVDAQGNPLSFEILECDPIVDVRYNPRRGHPTRTPAKKIKGLLHIPTIAPYGYLRTELLPGAPFPRGKRNLEPFYLSSAPAVMENEHLRVEIHANGTFDLTDKATAHTYPQQLLWEDSGEAGDCYVHQQPINERRIDFSVATTASVRQLYDTPLGCAYEIEQTLSIPDGLRDERTRRSDRNGSVTMRTVLFLGADAQDLKLSITVENHARNHRLRVMFPTNLSDATVSRSGQPFDTVERPIRRCPDPELPREQPYATCPMQDFCDVTDDHAGLCVAAAGIYEYECTDNASRTLALTVLRSVDRIDVHAFDAPEYVMQEALMMGKNITYHLALIPHTSDLSSIYDRVQAALLPPLTLLNRQSEMSVMTDFIPPKRDLPTSGQAVRWDGAPCVELTALKKGLKRDTLIVRLHNRSGEPVNGKITLCVPGVTPTAAYRVNMNEDRLRELTLCRSGNVSVSLRANEIATVEWELDAKA